MKKLLYIAPHLSTGGLPQYLVKKVELLIDSFHIYVVEYSDVTGGRLVVQRNRLKSILKNELITLSEDKMELISIIQRIQPDIVHLEEIPEMFCDSSLADEIYSTSRRYAIFETSHDSSFDIHYKRWTPDRLLLVSEYQRKLYSPLGIPIEVIDYPIEFISKSNRDKYRAELGLDLTKKHILNVGLFTPRKNQKEFFEYARNLPQYQFHSVGNMADNFRFYWEPLLEDVPPNLKIWDERSDVYKFFEAMDLFLFTSRGSNTDKETMPLVLKEAVSAKIPICLYNLDVYEGFFDQFNNIHYLDFTSIDSNTQIIEKVFLNNKPEIKMKQKIEFNSHWDSNEQLIYYSCNVDILKPIIVTLREYKSHGVLWSTSYPYLKTGVNYWMNPISKSLVNYETDETISGVILCIYDEETEEQLYEYPYYIKFVNQPYVHLSNTIPYFMNYSEFYLQKKFDRFLDRPYKNVVDVGANVGIFTQYLLDNKLANHITAIECDPLALKDLKRNFETNPLVTVIDRALHYENKPVTFYHSPDNPIISSLLSPDMLKSHMAGRKGDVEITVDTITIQNLTDTIGEIDLLKIDIEGGEYSIIENITEDQVNFIHNIMIECHFFEEGYKSKYYQLIKKLENFGFSVEEFIENQSDNIGASEVIFARRVK